MWTDLTQPFTFALPGFQTSELPPWDEAGQRWRRLSVVWPSNLATHSTEQTLYFDDDGLLARRDYDVEISGGTSGRTTSPTTPRSRASSFPRSTGSSRAPRTAIRFRSP